MHVFWDIDMDFNWHKTRRIMEGLTTMGKAPMPMPGVVFPSTTGSWSCPGDTRPSKLSRRGIRRRRQFDGIHAGPEISRNDGVSCWTKFEMQKKNVGDQNGCFTQPKVVLNHPKWWMIHTKMGSWLSHRTLRPRWCKGCGHLGPQRFHPTLG